MQNDRIKKATEAIRNCMPTTHINDEQVVYCEISRIPMLARAALPHLLEQPTAEEIVYAIKGYEGMVRDAIARELRNFCARRRNALTEPPQLHTVILEYPPDERNCVRSTILHVTGVKVDGVDVLAKPAASPVPDPRREAILEIVRSMAGENNGPRFLLTSEQWTDNLISAIDSLKGQ